jgi:AcrR family transcriptional regulator
VQRHRISRGIRRARAHRGVGSAGRPARRRDYHHGDLRAALLDTVGRIIRERGIAFVSIREVARRASVSHAAPAHHFRNKSGLLTAFAAQGYDRLADTISEAIASAHATTPPDVVEAMGRGYVRFALDNREHFGIMFRAELLDSQDEQYVRATDRAFAALRDTAARAVSEGYLNGADPMLTAASAWSLVHGLAALWLSGRMQDRTGASDADTFAAAVTALFVDKVMRRP